MRAMIKACGAGGDGGGSVLLDLAASIVVVVGGGGWRLVAVARARDSSMSRMARVASKPFMMGMLMSVWVGGVSTGRDGQALGDKGEREDVWWGGGRRGGRRCLLPMKMMS